MASKKFAADEKLMTVATTINFYAGNFNFNDDTTVELSIKFYLRIS